MMNRIWLLYPFVKGKGIALSKCKSGGIGNKRIYFFSIVTYIAFSILYCVSLGEVYKMIPVVIVLIYMLIAFHLVRKKSENELQRNQEFIMNKKTR